MAKLSREQLRYADHRLHDYRTAELVKIDNACKLPAPKVITYGELMKGIKRGTVKLGQFYASDKPVARSVSLNDAFGLDLPYSHVKFDERKKKAMVQALDNKIRDMRDRLYLGDATEILQLLQNI